MDWHVGAGSPSRSGQWYSHSVRDRLSQIGPPALAGAIALLIAGGHSIATDESFSWGVAAQPSVIEYWDGLRFVSGNMGGYFTVLRGWLAFGDGLVWLRLPGILAFVLTVVAVMRTAERWFNRPIAVWAGVLTATSVPLLYFAVEIRSYALVALATTLMWSALERSLATDSLRHWLSLGFWAGVAVSAHLIMVLVTPILALIVLARSGAGFFGSAIRLAPIGIFSLPTGVLLLLGDSADVDWILPLDIRSIVVAGRLLLGDHAQLTGEGSGPALMVLFLFIYLAAAVGIVRSAHRQIEDLYLWAWFLGLPSILVLVSFVEPLILHRYLIGSLPAGLIIAARWLHSLDRARVATVIVIVLAVLGGVRSVALSPHSADLNGELAAAIEARAQEGDALVVPIAWHRTGLEYQWRDGSPVEALAPFRADFDHSRLIERLDRGPSASESDWIAPDTRVWVMIRSDSAQTFVEVERGDEEFNFFAADQALRDTHTVAEEFDIQRFRVRLYEPLSGGAG